MKKKMYVLMAMLAMLAVSSAVCGEIKVEPGWLEYYTGKKGTSSYKLDWNTFYDRMDKAANGGQYRYIKVIYNPHDSVPETRLSFIYDNAFGGFYQSFIYAKKGVGVLSIKFFEGRVPGPFSSSYSDAVKKWNYYLDLM